MKSLYILMLAAIVLNTGCEKFLDHKSDGSLSIPENEKDIRALLDNDGLMNSAFPGLNDLFSDEYFIDYTVWKSRSELDQRFYVWDGDVSTFQNSSWFSSYKAVMISNVVLESIEKQIKDHGTTYNLNLMKGEALFSRAMRHFTVSQLYCAPYDPNGDNRSAGIPIRTSSDINEAFQRNSVEDTYTSILDDLKASLELLPVHSETITRPNKVAAFALLARIYLSMEKYEEALKFAKEAYSLNNKLLNYNTIDLSAVNPFEVSKNVEIIYFAKNVSSATYITKSRSNMDTLLLSQYQQGDLRREAFFEEKSNGYSAFKGFYSGLEPTLFCGLATDELYLIIAECETRRGNVARGMEILNLLLAHRYDPNIFEPIGQLDQDQLLDTVLAERRKELLFRGVRWSDLRRLNRDPRFRKDLKRRVFDGASWEEYELPAGDLRYVSAIPDQVIELSGMQQNPR